MKTYNFIYTINDKDYQIDINSDNETEAWSIIKNAIPNTDMITLLVCKNYDI